MSDTKALTEKELFKVQTTIRSFMIRPERQSFWALSIKLALILLLSFLPIAGFWTASAWLGSDTEIPYNPELSAQAQEIRILISKPVIESYNAQRAAPNLSDEAKTALNKIKPVLEDAHEKGTKLATQELVSQSETANLYSITLLFLAIASAVWLSQLRTARRLWLNALSHVDGKKKNIPNPVASIAIGVMVLMGAGIIAILIAKEGLYPLVPDKLNTALGSDLSVILGYATNLIAILGFIVIAFFLDSRRNLDLTLQDTLIRRAPVLLTVISVAISFIASTAVVASVQLPLLQEQKFFAAGHTWIVVAGLTLVQLNVIAAAFGGATLAFDWPSQQAVIKQIQDHEELERDDLKPTAPYLRKIAADRKETKALDKLGVDFNLSPASYMVLLRALILPLAVVMVLFLVMLNMWFELGEANLELEEPLLVAISEFHDGWLRWLGATFSLTLGICYILPALRIDPYVAAYEDAKTLLKSPSSPKPLAFDATIKASSKPKVWSFDAVQQVPATSNGKTLSEAYQSSLKERDISVRFGADEKKMAAIYLSPNYGASLQDILGSNLREKITSIATLLAPGVLGGLLNLLN